MALINVKKKVEKAADKLGLQPGEVVEAACTTNPAGTMKRMLAKEMGGVLGGAIAGSDAVDNAEDGMASAYPEGQNFLVVTDRRLLVASVGAMSGKPKELLAEWPRERVAGIHVEKGRMAAPLTVVFTDGSAVQVEGAKGTNPMAMAQPFEGRAAA